MQNRTKRILPPNKHPVGTRCIQIDIPDDDQWERDMYSEIYQLALWMLWERDADKSGTVVAKQWRQALKTWRHCDGSRPVIWAGSVETGMSIRQNPDNPCEIQSSEDGMTWCTFIDLSKCMNFGTQPGTANNQPKPGGGSQQYCYVLKGNQRLTIPLTVSTGDTVTLDSASGSACDPDEDPLHLPSVWRLQNGDQNFGGLDVGFPTTKSGDPINTANHMKIIAVAGSTFFDLTLGTPSTVPGGVSNAQLWLQVNDDVLTDNQGDFSVCVTVTNNANSQWTSVFDFTVNPYTALFSFIFGTWTPGTGYVGQPGTGQNSTVVLELPVPGRTIVSGALNYSSDGGDPSTSQAYINDGTKMVVRDNPIQSGSNIHIVGPSGTAGVTNLEIAIGDGTTGTFVQVNGVTVVGQGDKPTGWP